MKACKVCKEHFRLEDFPLSGGNGKRSTMCKTCKQEYDRLYHSKRSKKQLDRKYQGSLERKERNHLYILNYFKTHHCVGCGEADPLVLEFDHLDRENKLGDMGLMVAHSSIKTLETEISKCRVLCANCHRRHTAKQLGHLRYLLSVAQPV